MLLLAFSLVALELVSGHLGLDEPHLEQTVKTAQTMIRKKIDHPSHPRATVSAMAKQF